MLTGDKAKAYTDRYPEWSQQEWNGTFLKKNDIPDIVVRRGEKVSMTAQAKYYDSAENTTSNMSQINKEGQIKYEKVDRLVGPKDQIQSTLQKVSGESEPVPTTTIREHATAKAESLKNPVEKRAYEQTAAKCTDTLKDGKTSSTALTKADANKLGEGDKTRLAEIEAAYQRRSTLQQMGNAAVGAAALSAVVSGSINIFRYIHLAKEGKLTAQDATLKIVGETVAAAADSAVKASATTGVQSLMVRYGSEKAVVEVLAKQGLKSMLKTNTVTVGVVCAVDMVKDFVRLGMGEISKEEFFDRQGKGSMMTSAGVVGGSLGAAGASAVAASLGATAGTTAMMVTSLIGGLSGGMIAGLAMTLAIENGIERSYHDLVRNTKNLNEATYELERVSQTVFNGQKLFTKFLQADIQMETALQEQLKNIDLAGIRALDSIHKI